MFGVRRSLHVRETILVEHTKEITTDILEMGDYAVVHDGMATEDERVVIRLRHCCSCRGADVGE